MAANGNDGRSVRNATLALVSLAVVALEQAIGEPGRPRPLILATTLGLLVAPTLGLAWYLGRRGATTPSPGPMRPRTAAALLVVFLGPFAAEAARLVALGRCAMLEVVLLEALRNLGLGLVTLAHRPHCARLAAVVSLFLVLFAASLGAGAAVLAAVGAYAAAGTLWLMLAYWEGLNRAGAPHRFPRSAAAWVLVVTLVLSAALAVGPSRAATVLVGLMPTSGGTLWDHPEARGGVNDGDNEVGASTAPQSIGFTDSEVYLNSDRPSLYDSFNETYGEPFQSRLRERMIALGPQAAKEQRERPAENLRAGRQFPMVRRTLRPSDRRPDDRPANALLYVQGPTPVHLPLAAYDRFDGRAWHEEPDFLYPLGARPEAGGSWMRLPPLTAPFFVGSVAHRIKVAGLASSPLPTPPHLVRFRVGSVNRPDFFGWAQSGIVRMAGRTVPAGTVIDTEARTVDPRRLREARFFPRMGPQGDRHLDVAVAPAVAALARSWVAGVPEGWPQVEAVVAALRRDFVHDRTATIPPGTADILGHFLLTTRRGPDYQFATAAALLLRWLGYPTRLVSGYYVAPGRADPRLRHTRVVREDVHLWAEVRLPDGVWVAIEPTPGYRLMGPSRSWSECLVASLAAAWGWARAHAALLLAGSAGLALAVHRRREALDWLWTLAWRLRTRRGTRRDVVRTLELVERRARWAGHPRPPGLTPARWYGPMARAAGRDGDSPDILLGLVGLAGWALYAPDRPGEALPCDVEEIRATCRRAVGLWTLGRFQASVRSSSSPREEA